MTTVENFAQVVMKAVSTNLATSLTYRRNGDSALEKTYWGVQELDNSCTHYVTTDNLRLTNTNREIRELESCLQ